MHGIDGHRKHVGAVAAWVCVALIGLCSLPAAGAAELNADFVLKNNGWFSKTNPAVLKLVDDKVATQIRIWWGDGAVDHYNKNYGPRGDDYAHTYAAAGNYTIKVEVVAAGSVTVVDSSKSVHITANEIAPSVVLTNRPDIDARQGKTYRLKKYVLTLWDDGDIKVLTINWGDLMQTVITNASLQAWKHGWAYQVPVSAYYSVMINGKPKPVAGIYTNVVIAVDNTGTTNKHTYVFSTMNKPPSIASFGVSLSGLVCRAYLNPEKPMTALMKDGDGVVADWYFEFTLADKTTYVPGCVGPQRGTEVTCTFPNPGVYFIFLRAVDNLGAIATRMKRLTVK